MLSLIGDITSLLKTFTKEVHYQWNHTKPITYPYVTYTITTEPLDNDNQIGIYVDFDVFDDQGRNNERIETVCANMQAFFMDKNNTSVLTDKYLMRMRDLSISPFATGSDTLQRRTGQFHLKIDWRK